MYGQLRNRPSTQTDDMSNIREQRIRAAIQQVLDMPEGTLGNYSGAQAFGSAAGNYGMSQNMRSSLGNFRKGLFGMGGKKSKNSRKTKKTATRKH